MKENLVSMGRWVVAGILLLAIGVLMITGMGRKRGTRSYRWRVALWAMLLGFTGAAPLVMMGCDDEKKDKSEDVQPTCYAVEFDGWEDPDDATTDPPDQQVLCYAPRPEELVTCYKDAAIQPWPDIQPTCYKPLPPDVVVMCYEDASALPDLQPPPEDIIVMCYEAALDVTPQQDVPPIMCYAEAPSDVKPQ